VTWTATRLPYIDYVLDDRIAVAVVCNGKGAKSNEQPLSAHLAQCVSSRRRVALPNR
jgi:hypothetical protein